MEVLQAVVNEYACLGGIKGRGTGGGDLGLRNVVKAENREAT